jgi:hypothetical protein
MAVEVNGVEDLRAWAISKACNEWRRDRSCTHPGCRQDQRATNLLAAMERQPDGRWLLDESAVDLDA